MCIEHTKRTLQCLNRRIVFFMYTMHFIVMPITVIAVTIVQKLNLNYHLD